jgi:hypothetical protein
MQMLQLCMAHFWRRFKGLRACAPLHAGFVLKPLNIDEENPTLRTYGVDHLRGAASSAVGVSAGRSKRVGKEPIRDTRNEKPTRQTPFDPSFSTFVDADHLSRRRSRAIRPSV